MTSLFCLIYLFYVCFYFLCKYSILVVIPVVLIILVIISIAASLWIRAALLCGDLGTVALPDTTHPDNTFVFVDDT